MNKISSRTTVFIISLISYAIIIGIIIFSIVNFRQEYRREETNYIKNVQESIVSAVHSEDIESRYEELRQRYAIEVILYEGKELVYQTIPLKEGAALKGIVNDNAKVLERFQKIDIEDKEYTLWYVIYQVPFIKTMESFLARINIIVILIYIVLITLIILFEFRLLLPLQRVAKAVAMAENNELDALELEKSSDELNHRLTNFFLKQRRTLSSVRSQNTALELDLALEREHLENTIHLSRGLIHDLKSPIYNVKMDCELRLEQEHDMQERNLLTRTIDVCTQLLMEINGLLKVLREDVYTIDKSVEEIDGVALVYATQKHHVAEMRGKHMSFFFEGNEKEMFFQNKVGVQLLFHNVFSNMVLYSVPNSSIEIVMERSGQDIIILCKNQTDEKNMQRLRNGMKYDSLSDAFVSDSGNAFSSGNGLYLIRQLAKFLDGECNYTFEDDMVVTKLILPDKE